MKKPLLTTAEARALIALFDSHGLSFSESYPNHSAPLLSAIRKLEVSPTRTNPPIVCSHDFCLVDDEGSTRCSKCGKLDPSETI